MIRFLVVLLVAVCATVQAGDSRKIELGVDGMHCDNCAVRVKSALQKVEDVHDVTVNMKTRTVQVTLASASASSSELLAKTVAAAGFGASYLDGNETRTVAASKSAHHDNDCVATEGEGAHCSDEGMSDCCADKSSKKSKVKELKKK